MSYFSTAIKKARYLITRDTDQVLVLEKNNGAFIDVVLDTAQARDAAINVAIGNILAGAPGALDTLNELAAALGDDASFSATVATALANRLQTSLNLSDLADAPTARANLGLGSAALHPDTDFDTPAGRDAAINTAVTNLLNGAPGALDTLNELATALGDDASFSATVSTALANRLQTSLNLSDLPNASTARTNLGLGTSATHPSTDYVGVVEPPPKVWFDPTVGLDPGDTGYSSMIAGQIHAPLRTIQGVIDTIPYILDSGVRAWAAAEITWRGQGGYDYAIGDARLPVIPLSAPLYMPRHVKLKLGKGNVSGGRAQCQILANFSGPMVYPNIGNDIEGGVWTNSHALGDGICLTVLKTLSTDFGNLVGRDLHLRGMIAHGCGHDGWVLSSNWIDRAVIEDFAALWCGRSGMRLTPDDASSGTSSTPKMAQDFTLRNGLINNCGSSTDAQFHAAGSALGQMGGGAGIVVEHLTIFQDAVSEHYEYMHLEGMANAAFRGLYLEDAAAIRMAPMIVLTQSPYDTSVGGLTDGGMWNYGVSFEHSYFHPNRYDSAAAGLTNKAWLFDIDAAFAFRYAATNVIHGGSSSLTGTQANAPTATNPLFWLHNTHGVKNADIDARIATNYYRSTQWGQTPGVSAIVKDDN